MSQVTIQQQIDAIKKATVKATRSKQAALKFLMEAGIIEKKPRKTIVKKCK